MPGAAMLILRDPNDASGVSDPAIRALIDLRLRQLGHIHDGLLVVVESGDGVEALESVSGSPLLHDPFEDVPFGHPDFTPSFDYLEAHHDEAGRTYGYEMHFDTSDDGIGTTLFIPAQESIDANLLALCVTYAIPALAKP